MAAYTNRRVTVEADDPTTVVSAAPANPMVLGTVLIRAGDIIDVGIDWKAFGAANDAKLKTSLWAAHASTPVAPTLVAPLTSIDGSRQHTVVLVNASAAAVGDNYYISNTVTMEDLTPGATDYDFADRTLVRVLHVQVTA